jgi:hypothetical protein
VQGNVVILPEAQARRFLRYCQRNPKPCPLLAVSEPGQAQLPALGDVTSTSAPTCRVTACGATALVDEPTDITALWRDDLVTFVLGCSFSFEQACWTPACRCAMSSRAATWPCTAPISHRGGRYFPRPHGGVHAAHDGRGVDPRGADHLALSRRAWRAGAPGRPGRRSASRPGPPRLRRRRRGAADEIPVFWACGVTPQAALVQARPAVLAITHAPGCMLVTDLLNHQLASFCQLLPTPSLPTKERPDMKKLAACSCSRCMGALLAPPCAWRRPSGTCPRATAPTPSRCRTCSSLPTRWTKATGGKLKITLHPGASLFKANEIKRAVQTGQTQIGEFILSGAANENAAVRRRLHPVPGHQLRRPRRSSDAASRPRS